MFKKILIGISAIALMSSPAMSKGFSSGSSYSSSRSSYSSSSYSSPSRPSYSTPSYKSSSYTTPTYTKPVASPRYTSGSTYSNNSGRYQSTSNAYRQPVQQNVVHHYDSNPIGSTLGSPFFWMWAMDHNRQQAPVVVQQPAQVIQGQPDGGQIIQQAPVTEQGPGFFATIFWGIFNLIVLIAIVSGLVWAGFKIRKWWRNRK